MPKKPLVSVIIVNLNGGEVFKECLKSLSKIDYPKWELVVVDNGSTDGSERLPQNFQFPISNFQLIKNTSNLGFAKANNQGYEKAKGKYILLLNNDTKVEPDFLIKLVERMEEDKTIGVIQPKILLMDKPRYLDNVGSFFTKTGFLDHWGYLEKDSQEFSKETEIFSAKGACMFVRRDVVRKIGLFDEDFISYFEETDFCWRVWLTGSRVVYYPQARIFHKVAYTTRRQNLFFINYHSFKNRICSLIKNLEPENLLLVMSTHLFILFGLIFLYFIQLKPARAWIVFKAILWNIFNLTIVLSKRSAVQKQRKLSDSEIFKAVSTPLSSAFLKSQLKYVGGNF